ncbi:periplasmic chaperone for outer membrane proteins SurA [Rhodovulum sp. ES.010]|uniref:peptidylprolyl isomerase n=1 Tax=Rhodovulum sp. ES.010 TaxID=1882821 RepID=UPI00092C0D0E|nr:peptidylprolyl isomerase [Rhodovulum sp. ES.010]SIO23610.1 periplasmic chaperone for outer membrane proteins SurA [Rhodovulum sp. ES.010]
MIRRMGLAAIAAVAMLAAGIATAQQGGPFAPRLFVNDKAITNYEFEQRVRFVRLLGNPPDIETVALQGLVDDRLRMAEAERLGVSASPEEIEAGMEEFAARANLGVEQFIAAIGQAGVAAETFRDFVEAGLTWRQVVRARFGPRAQVTEAEIDRALAITSPQSGAAGAQVLLAEIILRADTPRFRAEAEELAAELRSSIRSEADFAAAARRYSVSRSRDQGGRMGWLPLANLPRQVAGQVLTLGPGEVTAPVDLDNAIALFQLRAIRETGAARSPEAVAVEYARFLIPGGSLAEAMRVRGRVDTCDDLYGVAKGLPAERLSRETRPVAEVPDSVAMELAKLDEGEISYGLSTPQTAVVLMLCGRTPELGEGTLDRETVRRQLLNQRLGGYAESYLAELEADAIIREP